MRKTSVEGNDGRRRRRRRRTRRRSRRRRRKEWGVGSESEGREGEEGSMREKIGS